MKVLMHFAWRSPIAKFRTGVAPRRLETGRYEGLGINQRTCFNCNENVESEQHVLLKCPLYEDLQQTMFNQAFNINTGFLFTLLIARCDIGVQLSVRSSVPASVRASVNTFKHEYLCNQSADWNEILSEASLGWGKDFSRF